MEITQEVIGLFKTLTNCANDTEATYYLEDAVEIIKDITNRTEAYVLETLKKYVIKIAVIEYGKKGSESLKSQSYSGASEAYIEEIPKDIKKALYNHRLFKRSVET